MDKKQLLEIWPETVAKEWHKHKKGGGWIHKEAKVELSVFVAETAVIRSGQVSGDAQVSGNARVSGDAQVYGNAWVSGDARVYGDARVSGDAQVSGNARVSGDAQVSGNAQVYGNARVSGDAQVSGNARVSGDAQVYGNAWVSGDARVYGDAWSFTPLFIAGTRFGVCISKANHLKIGCEEHEISWWLKNYKNVANTHGCAELIPEYYEYIKLAAKWWKLFAKKQAECEAEAKANHAIYTIIYKE